MGAQQRVNYLYERLNTRVLGVDRDDVATNKQFVEYLKLDFPLGSSVTARVGQEHGVYPTKEPYPPRFSRRVIVIDKKGIVRYIKDGSPDLVDILNLLMKLEEESKIK